MTRPAQPNPSEPPAWMLAEIADGIQRLIYLGLPGAPAMEIIEGTVRAWAEALMSLNKVWQQDLDAGRIRHAFWRLSGRVDKWPAPCHLLDALPDRAQPRQLPEPEMSEEQRRKNFARFAQILTDALGDGGPGGGGRRGKKKPPNG